MDRDSRTPYDIDNTGARGRFAWDGYRLLLYSGVIGIAGGLAAQLFVWLSNLAERLLLVDRRLQADGFAQVFPEHKFHVVYVLQRHNHIVGMTGDDVNDAPALRKPLRHRRIGSDRRSTRERRLSEFFIVAAAI